MEKISIIDLLNKVANGEEMPKLVKYHNYIYAYDEELCNYEFEESYLFDYTTSLNNEVEVIEDKKIEKIKIEQDTPSSNFYIKNEYGTKYALTKHNKIIVDKINEIIDYLEEL